MAKTSQKLTIQEKEEILGILENRFKKNIRRHKNLEWKKIQEKLEDNPAKLWTLYQMEKTEGEPDLVRYDKKEDVFIFMDCSAESPKGRRSICYDRKALDARKQHKPANSAMDLANEMGIEMLNEEQYHELQELGEFDLKTSSWVLTPEDVRSKGGALFCDRRYGKVFTYHNGADSYYAARGFRGILKV